MTCERSCSTRPVRDGAVLRLSRFEYVSIPHPVASLGAGQIRERARGLLPDLVRILGVE